MIETVRRVAVVVCAVVAVVVVSPAAAVGPVATGCAWVPQLLPLPDDTFDGMVTAGDGAWLAGVGYDPDEGLLWREGRLVAHESAFGLATKLTAVNADGVAVGSVTGQDGRRHAVRRVAAYEYLPETAGSSMALDVNARGEAVGYDGRGLMVWPLDGPTHTLVMPAGAAPYGSPAIDDDGTVVVRTGRLVDGVMRWQGYMWTQAGVRVAVPADEVRDVRGGWVVGTLGTPEAMAVAAGWDLGDGRPRVYAGGVAAVAVSRTGVVVGAGPAGEPLVWTDAGVPSGAARLPSPPGYHEGSATAVNDRDAAGFVSPEDDAGTVPIRWACR